MPLNQAGLPDGGKPFINGDNYQSEYSIVIGGTNFGCGSSREHAPLPQTAGIKVVVRNHCARIFYRNSVDGGFVIPYECAIKKLNDKIKTGDTIEIDIDANIIKNIPMEKLSA